MIAGRVGIVAGSGVGVLGRQHDPVAVPRHELAQQLFAGTVGVDVGGVDEVAARLQEGVVDVAAFVVRRAPAPILAESHRPQAQLRDSQAAFA
jgi:hypothetical protein